MIKIFLYSILFSTLLLSGRVQAEEDRAVDTPLEDDVVDFLKLENPFLSQLPKQQIIKTPVEQPKQTDNNVNKLFNGIPPIEQTPVLLPNFDIQGVVYGVKDPQVIINDQSYGLNEYVLGAQIKSISKKGITFLFGGRDFSVALDN